MIYKGKAMGKQEFSKRINASLRLQARVALVGNDRDHSFLRVQNTNKTVTVDNIRTSVTAYYSFGWCVLSLKGHKGNLLKAFKLDMRRSGNMTALIIERYMLDLLKEEN